MLSRLAYPLSWRSSPSPARKNSEAPSCSSLALSFLAAQLNLQESLLANEAWNDRTNSCWRENVTGILEIGAVAESKDGETQRLQAVGIVELLASEVLPELPCVLGHISLPRRRRDKDNK